MLVLEAYTFLFLCVIDFAFMVGGAWRRKLFWYGTSFVFAVFLMIDLGYVNDFTLTYFSGAVANAVVQSQALVLLPTFEAILSFAGIADLAMRGGRERR